MAIKKAKPVRHGKRPTEETRVPKGTGPIDECEVCGASPVVEETGLCGPCTFGEAETAGGAW